MTIGELKRLIDDMDNSVEVRIKINKDFENEFPIIDVGWQFDHYVIWCE